MLPMKKSPTSAPAKRGAFSRALARFREQRAAENRIIRIGFIVDATGSRQQSWEAAQAIQGRMFRSVAGLGKVAIRLVHFGGDRLIDHGWRTDTHLLAREMAAVRCQPGLTQIIPALDLFLMGKTDAIILVGDAFEEHPAALSNFLQLFVACRIPVFAFLEGESDVAESAFREIAEKTGGRFARLGDDLPLGDLCEGVALLTAGGEKAVRRLGNARARALLLNGPADSGGR